MKPKRAFAIRPLVSEDAEWVRQKTAELWGAETVIARCKVFKPANLPGLAAFSGPVLVGFLTYYIDDCACEIVTLNSFCEGVGVGSMLIEQAVKVAKNAGCNRIWLVTTNDNTHALHFYHKHGFHITMIHTNAIEDARILKPEIPLTGENGIPIRDEIEMELD